MQIPCVYIPGPAPAVSVANIYFLLKDIMLNTITPNAEHMKYLVFILMNFLHLTLTLLICILSKLIYSLYCIKYAKNLKTTAPLKCLYLL